MAAAQVACLVRAGVFPTWREAFEAVRLRRPCVKLNAKMRAALDEWEVLFGSPRTSPRAMRPPKETSSDCTGGRAIFSSNPGIVDGIGLRPPPLARGIVDGVEAHKVPFSK